MVIKRRQKLLNKILKRNMGRTINPYSAEEIIKATIIAVTNELLEETTQTDFGDSERGENFLSAVPESTIIRIRDEWLE